MNNIQKDIVNEEGRNETIIASSDDNYQVNLDKKYRLNNYSSRNQSNFAKKFKKSILGSDIGVKSRGFSSIAILATVIALAAIAIIYFALKF